MRLRLNYKSFLHLFLGPDSCVCVCVLLWLCSHQGLPGCGDEWLSCEAD